MDYNRATFLIYPDANFNSACYQFSEAEARVKNLWRDDRAMPTEAELLAALAEADKEDQVKTKYDEMVSDVYAQMEATFGTKNDVSAAAFAATYEAMLLRPAAYVDLDLGFADEAAVIAYATARISAADDYAKYRLKRIAQYQDEKAAIEGA